jgi:RNA polymerase sigma factor (sigma-70 family)
MSDQEVLDKIRKGDESALDYLYTKHYRMLVNVITKNNGTEDEAKDIYQDALVNFWQKSRKPDFELTAKISTYLYSVCQNLWLKELNRKSRLGAEDLNAGFLPDYDEKEKNSLVEKCLNQLGESCKKILMLYYFDDLSMEDIAKEMGFANADTAKTKKYKCKNELEKIVKKNYSEKDFKD